MLALFALLFLAIACVSSLPRFGQRENEYATVTSDSDVYLDMAHVFLGDAPAFNPALIPGRPHHYGRPLLPFTAAYLSRYLLHDNLRAAFSVVDVLGATLVAFLLFVWMEQFAHGERFTWLPSVLFLTAFPQIDWGYHILTDTLGFATAFAAAFYAAWLIGKTDDSESMPASRWTLHLLSLAGLSSIAFLARETEWFAVITAGFVVVVSPAAARLRARRTLIVAALVAGEVPRFLYTRHFALGGVPVWSNAHMLVSPAYLLDWFVKTGVAFNFCWFAALGGAVAIWRKRDWTIPAVIVGWSIAGVLYMLDGYRVNSMDYSGFPPRLAFGVFPLVFWMVRRCFVDWVKPRWQTQAVVAFCVLHAATSFLGVALDGAKGRITILDLVHNFTS